MKKHEKHDKLNKKHDKTIDKLDKTYNKTHEQLHKMIMSGFIAADTHPVLRSRRKAFLAPGLLTYIFEFYNNSYCSNKMHKIC